MATQSYNVAGGTFYVDPPDPLEVRMKLAQLAALEQAPATERAKLNIEQQAEQRQLQALRQSGELGRSQLEEERGFHAGTLDEARRAREANIQDAQQKLAEETRYHTGQLGESKADREARVADALATRTQTGELEREKIKAGTAGNIMAHLANTLESKTEAPGALGKVLTAAGVPAYEEGLKTAETAEGKRKALEALPEFQRFSPEQRTAEMSKLAPATRSALTEELGKPTAAGQAPVATAPTGEATPGANLSGALKYAPIDLANMGADIANYGALPLVNTLNSLFSLPAIPRQKKMPRNYQQALAQFPR